MPTAEETFSRVYAVYGPALYRFCLLQMKHPADAEDVLQEVFIKRLYQSPEFDSPEHERRWLFRVAVNQCRDEWKRHRRRDLPLDTAELVVLPPEEREVLEAVMALPEKLRTVIHLYYYEGYAVREIAQLLGVTVSTVKMRMKRGRDALRERLEDAG